MSGTRVATEPEEVRILCRLPEWVPRASNGWPLGLSALRFMELHPVAWADLLDWLGGIQEDPMSGTDDPDWWRGTAIDPESDPAHHWFFVRQDGVVFRKWICDSHYHGEDFYFRADDGGWGWDNLDNNIALPDLWSLKMGAGRS